jgi:hypothetical protein
MDGNSPAARQKRLVRSGDAFNSDELRDGLIELERVSPAPEPAEERSHPAELPDDPPRHHRFLGRLRGD